MNELPGPFISRRQSRLVDEISINRFGIPGIVLMENAGRNCAAYVLDNTSGPVLICCGTGNNGGDGFVIARHLHNQGRDCSVLLAGPEERFAADAGINYHAAKAMKLPVAIVGPDSTADEVEAAMTVDGDDPAVIIEALLGTGASGPPRPPMSTIVIRANRSNAVRIAIDVPAGVNCDSGEVSDPAFQAHATLTFVAQKIGFQSDAARHFTGAVHVMDIGAPREAIELALKENHESNE